jgi:hypothetical protein
VVRGALSYTQVTCFHGAILIAGPVPDHGGSCYSSTMAWTSTRARPSTSGGQLLQHARHLIMEPQRRLIWTTD